MPIYNMSIYNITFVVSFLKIWRFRETTAIKQTLYIIIQCHNLLFFHTQFFFEFISQK